MRLETFPTSEKVSTTDITTFHHDTKQVNFQSPEDCLSSGLIYIYLMILRSPLIYSLGVFVALYFVLYSPEILRGNHDFRNIWRYVLFTGVALVLIHMATNGANKDKDT